MMRRGKSLFTIDSWRWGGAISAVGCVALWIAAAISWYAPFVPRVHDEFSYLLAADTLLHGRLANPTPDVWQPFQSFHILLQPSYASKYPLGHGAIVALGWRVFGAPIAGCWIAAGLCAASITWMLGGVTSRRWAILGGLLVAMHPAMQANWSHSLISGWLTAAGSALLAGGILRLRRRFTFSAAAALGAGVCLMALTRPFEGLVATLISGGVLWRLWQARELKTRLSIAARAIPVAAAPVAAAMFLMGMQNYATTGKLTSMPYQLHERQYGVAPLFVFGQPKIPGLESTDHIPAMVDEYHYGWSLDSYRQRVGARGWLVGMRAAWRAVWNYWALLATVSLLTLGSWVGFRLPRLFAVATCLQLFASSGVCWIFPHYLSPILPWVVTLAILGLRRIFHLFQSVGVIRVGRPLRFACTILAVQCLLIGISVRKIASNPHVDWAVRRAAIESHLASEAGKHLVLVDYGAEHNVHEEWVYNGADLEGGRVIWARGERNDWNDRLLARYAGSHYIWRLVPDQADASPTLISSPDWH